MNLNHKENFYHLLIGVLLVTFLTGIKFLSSDKNFKTTSFETFSLIIDKEPVSLSQLPISNQCFYTFSQETYYKTWREKENILPNWKFPQQNSEYTPELDSPSWKKEPDEPVLWITQKDALAFCQWMTKKQGDHHYRLPTAQELEQFNIDKKNPFFGELWQWTSENFINKDPRLQTPIEYAISWRQGFPLNHDNHINVEEAAPTTFRVIF